MAYKNSKWQIVTWKEKIKKLNDKVNNNIEWSKFYYIGKTKTTWSRIVYYEWTIIKQDWWLVTISYMDRNIHINPNHEYKILKDIPLKVLHLY